jgi:hypothetical protein
MIDNANVLLFFKNIGTRHAINCAWPTNRHRAWTEGALRHHGLNLQFCAKEINQCPRCMGGILRQNIYGPPDNVPARLKTGFYIKTHSGWA